MRSVNGGGPAALAGRARVGAGARSDGPEPTNDQGTGAGAAASRDCSWRSRAVERSAFATVQQVRRAFPLGDGGQQHRFSLCARIAGQGSAAVAMEVIATAPATTMATSRRMLLIVYGYLRRAQPNV
jgi:hypothetical protein